MNNSSQFINSPWEKTLLFLVTGFPPDVSGVSLYNWERALWLAKNTSCRIIVLAPDWQCQEAERGYPSERPDNFIVDCYPSKPWPPYLLTHVPKFSSARWIKSKLNEYEPDLITVTDTERIYLLGTWQNLARGYARRKRIPLLAEYHTDLYNFSATYPGWQWLRWLVKVSRLTASLYRQYDLTLCASEAAQESCTALGIPNTKVIPFLGVDVSSYSPSLRDRTALHPWLNEAERDNHVFLYLGRLGHEKRVDLLIRAFNHLVLSHPNCSLIVAGDGPTDIVDNLMKLSADTPNVHFTGFLMGERKARVLASCDVFCSPSPYETFGRTLVEAMASGTPLLSVSSGAVTEYIENGKNGYLVKYDDVEALAQAMIQTLELPREATSRHAIQDAQGFSLEVGCQKLLALYNCLLGFPFRDS